MIVLRWCDETVPTLTRQFNSFLFHPFIFQINCYVFTDAVLRPYFSSTSFFLRGRYRVLLCLGSWLCPSRTVSSQWGGGGGGVLTSSRVVSKFADFRPVGLLSSSLSICLLSLRISRTADFGLLKKRKSLLVATFHQPHIQDFTHLRTFLYWNRQVLTFIVSPEPLRALDSQTVT